MQDVMIGSESLKSGKARYFPGKAGTVLGRRDPF
jgi:hypothetical protein